MKFKRSIAVFAVGATLAGSAFGMCNEVSDASNINGYVPSNDNFANGKGTDGTLYFAINDAAFNATVYTSNKLFEPCLVKQVGPDKTGKKWVTSYINYGDRNSDHCSLLRYSSSIWSKLSQGKLMQALDDAVAIQVKVDGLLATNKMNDDLQKATAIKGKAAALQTCITELVQ